MVLRRQVGNGEHRAKEEPGATGIRALARALTAIEFKHRLASRTTHRSNTTTVVYWKQNGHRPGRNRDRSAQPHAQNQIDHHHRRTSALLLRRRAARAAQLTQLGPSRPLTWPRESGDTGPP